jgi:predicted amidohydrolase YtcJ
MWMPRRILQWFVVSAAIGSAPVGRADSQPQTGGPPADLVVRNGLVWTGVPGAAEAQAIAVAGDRIVAVGSDEEISSRIGPATRVIDAGGRRVIPGITDCHTHMVWGGLGLSRIDLRNAVDRTDFRNRIAAAVAKLHPGEWLLGGQWSVDSWDQPEFPTRQWIDDLTPGTPVCLTRIDGHQALVNSVALKFAAIDVDGPADPPGGEIVRDPKTRQPTGILKDAAMDLVTRRIPEPTVQEKKQALVRAMQHANRFGVTAVHDMSEPAELDAIALAHDEDLLTLRFTVYLSVSDWKANVEKVKNYRVHDDWLHVAGFKGFMDGSLGSRNAYLREPFDDATPETKYPRGMLTAMADPPSKFAAQILAADAAGLQPAVHAIGDEANHILLDLYEQVSAKAGAHDRRARVEHAQHLLPEDISRFARLGVIPSMQPHHKADDGRYAETALGHKRCASSYAFRSLLDSGAKLCFGSDWPVVTLSPFAGIATAVDARTLDGRVWFPEQSITAEQALTAYTVTAAYATHREDRLGTLEPGKLADIVILSQDILRIEPDRIAATIATHTIVGGQVVWVSPAPR